MPTPGNVNLSRWRQIINVKKINETSVDGCELT